MVILLSVGLILTSLTSTVGAVSLNEDGKAVVRLAADEYNRITEDNPIVSDKALIGYVNTVGKNLIPEGGSLPA